MSKPNSYHVLPHPEGGWQVKKQQAERASSLHSTKESAIERGRDLARQEESQLFIHRQDGTFQEERTYGSDPYPPRG